MERFSDFRKGNKLRESKESTINKCINLTQEQKDWLVDFFNGKGQSHWGDIDWNQWKTLTWDDFRQFQDGTSDNKRKHVEAVEGTDYEFVLETEGYRFYRPLTHTGSVYLASDDFGVPVKSSIPQWYSETNDPYEDYDLVKKFDFYSDPRQWIWSGAKWCISLAHTSKYWDEYAEDGHRFLFAIAKSEGSAHDPSSVKVAIDEVEGEFWNVKDHTYPYDRVPLQVMKGFCLSKFTTDEDGRRVYDSEGMKIPYCFVRDGRFLVEFDKVMGGFDCSWLDLTTLEGGPKWVEGEFDCSNNKLRNLKGAPEYVGEGFNCDTNHLTSLEGAPNKVSWFSCSENNLKSLKGAPEKVGCFWCNSNNLTTLKGSPKVVLGDFYCEDNKLSSLDYAPDKVSGNFYCEDNTREFTREDYKGTLGGEFNGPLW